MGMGETVKTKYYSYSGKTYDRPKDTKIEEMLQRVVKDRKSPKYCQFCNGRLEYKGLGAFECTSCKVEHLSNYGKLRKVLDNHGAMTMSQILELTDLSREDIKELIDDGSVEIVRGNVSLLN